MKPETTNAYILVVDDEPDIRSLLKEILEDEGYEVAVAANGEAARRARKTRRPDLVLLDIWMPDVDGISLLKEWTEQEALNTPVIMMSGHGTVETAVEATRLGAYDFIEKPLSLAKLLVTVQRGLEAYNLYRENAGLRHQVQPVGEPVGRSPAMQRLREQARRIAQHGTAVLIGGEPGSGKGAFARYLHDSSPRRHGPFIDVNVASLVGDQTVELFGSEEGESTRYGLIEQANGGTLYLHDVADLDLTTQARLLGALETGALHRLDGGETVKVDVRVVAGTRHDLARRIEEGRFRADLYYHLNVVPFRVPPLREHPEDIPDLIAFYVDHFVTGESLPYRDFSVAAQNRLRNYPWPGNVRELKNVVQRLLIIGGEREVAPDEAETALGAVGGAPQAAAAPLAFDQPLREAREQFERHYFEHQLRVFEGAVNKVAQHAGIERTHLYRKLRALGIDYKSRD